MSASTTRILTSWPLMLSLFLLLLNDWYLKAAYGNWFTGKLSDFAGIFLLALFLFALLPRHKGVIAIVICIAFTLWKSPLSAPVLDMLNSQPWVRFHRVVDYTDLLALALVPVAWGYALNDRPFLVRAWRPAAAMLVSMLAITSMVATTMTPSARRFDVRAGETQPAIDREVVAAAIQSVAEQFKMTCRECSQLQESGEYSGYPYYLKYKINEDDTISIDVSSKNSFPWGGGNRRARKLQRALRRALEPHIQGIKFVNEWKGSGLDPLGQPKP